MNSDIYRFLKNIFYFSVPFIVLIAVLVYVDPYNVLRKEKNGELEKLKEKISYRINYPLFALQKYDNDPADIIILGDSRANSLKEDLFEQVTGKRTVNLAYGGGSAEEIIKTFWVASTIHAPKEVYIGINFNLYNAFNHKDRVTEADELRHSVLSYLLSKYCFKSTFLILKAYLLGKKISLEKPPMTRDAFWQYQLDISGPYFFENYSYPVSYFKRLQKIADYCKKHGIKLIFFIPPTHRDLQLKIKQYGLEKENKKFIKDLVSFGVPVYNFNFLNEMTVDKKNFKDPFHFNETFGHMIINIITGKSDAGQRYRTVYQRFYLFE